MAGTGWTRTAGKGLFTVLALAGCVVTAGVVIASLQGSLVVKGTTAPFPFLSVIGAAGIFIVALIVILVLLLVFQIISLLMSSHPRIKNVNFNVQRRSQLSSVLAFLTVLGLILVLVRFGHYSGAINLHPITLGNRTIDQNTTGVTTGGGFAGTVLQALALTLFIPLIITIIIVAGIIVAALVKREEPADAIQMHGRTAFAAAVESQISGIEQGGDPRRAVIRVYKEMRTRLGVAGAAEGATLTPREFGAGAISLLGLSAGTVNSLTYLYEEAKFSMHPITEKERESAITLLKSVVEELTAGGIRA